MDTVQQQKQEMVPAFLLNECKRYLSLIANITGRNIIVYYSGWLKSNVFETSINENDKNAFMNAVYGMDKKKELI